MVAYLLCALLAVDQPAGPAQPAGAPQQTSLAHPVDVDGEAAKTAQEPPDGAGVSPVELIPRVELRHSFLQLDSGAEVQDTTAEIDIQFVRRILLRYEVPRRSLTTPDGTRSGFGDTRIGALFVVASDAQRLFGLIAGAVLDTASQPQLGQGKQQVFFGVGGALKPRPWLLTFLILQEQLAVAGSSMRDDINQAAANLGVILFGKQFNWVRTDLLTTVDFPGGAKGRFFGTLEVGSLVVGRVGLFVRAGTQFLGPAELDYSVAAGVRYLFKLEKASFR